jgi:hypothetical protein
MSNSNILLKLFKYSSLVLIFVLVLQMPFTVEARANEAEANAANNMMTEESVTEPDTSTEEKVAQENTDVKEEEKNNVTEDNSEDKKSNEENSENKDSEIKEEPKSETQEEPKEETIEENNEPKNNQPKNEKPEQPRDPKFPDCDDLISKPGDQAHFTEGMHQIVGDGLKEGADDVYLISGGNAVQCFCPTTGMGIQTNWWKTDKNKDGWIEVESGEQWNLEDHAYLAKNSDFHCNPPVFPPCKDLISSPGDLAHFTEGMHQIVGDGLKEGADDVYSLSHGNAVQCFCPTTGMGIQTNWWKTDKTKAGWIEVEDGTQWNLSAHAYLAMNSDFNCNPPVFPPCEELVADGPGDLAHFSSGMHQIVGDGLKEGADDVYSISGGNAVQCFCPTTGMGIQTNWWKTNQDKAGWIQVENGTQWNLENHAYLAKNMDYDCNEPDQGGGEEPQPGANITVTKVVINDDGGTAKVEDFLLKVGQAVVTSGVLATNFPAGEYNVTESEGPQNYTATFSGDCDSNGHITMTAGQTYTCTITNNDDQIDAGGSNEGGGGSTGGTSTSSSGGGGGGGGAAPAAPIVINPAPVALAPVVLGDSITEPDLGDVGGGEDVLPRTGMSAGMIYIIIALWLFTLARITKRSRWLQESF